MANQFKTNCVKTNYYKISLNKLVDLFIQQMVYCIKL